jgi:hypothetical protein
MFCPKCKSEFIEGITICSDCHIPLMETLPKEKDPIHPSDLVCLKTFMYRHEAEIEKGLLEANGIDSLILGDDAGGLRPEIGMGFGINLMVRQDELKTAQEILDNSENNSESDTEDNENKDDK